MQNTEDIKQQVFDNGFIVIPNATFTKDSLLTYTKKFGEVVCIGFENRNDVEYPGLIDVTNVNPDGSLKVSTFGQYWHQDGDYRVDPYVLSFLYCVEAPKEGGETSFFSTVDLYNKYVKEDPERLSELSELKIRISVDDIPDFKDFDEAEKAKYPTAYHNIVFKHRLCGKKAIYPSSLDASIDGKTTEESKAIINSIIDFGATDSITHKWTPGDLVIWDNTLVMHMASKYAGNERRTLWRTQAQLA